MSDIFFIVSSVCIVIITILLSVLLVKVINALDGVNDVVNTTKGVTNNINQAVSNIASFGLKATPFLAIIRAILKRKNSGKTYKK